MTEGTMANASELEPPAIEQQTPEVEDDGFFSPDLETDAIEAGDEEGGEGDESQAEFMEIERNGKKYSIPKELEPELLMNADYTRKTQETAALRKQVEAEREQVRVMATATQGELEARGTLTAVDAQLKQYENTDWDKFEQNDPMLAQSEWRKFQQLQAGRSQITAYLDNAQRERSEQTQQDIAKRLQETAEYAHKEIKGWTPELDGRITDFAVNSLGYDVETLKSAYTPKVYNTLYLAYLGSEVLKKQAAPKPVQSSAQPLKTVVSKSGPSARKPLSEMDMDEYAAHRNRQESAARARASR